MSVLPKTPLGIADFVVRILLTLAFAGSVLAKLSGQEMATQMFDNIGIPGLMYLVILIYVVAIVLLWIPGRAGVGTALLGGAMVGAVLSHLIYGDTAVPAIVLGLLSAFSLYVNRADALKVIGR